MSIQVNEFRYVQGKNDAEYIKLLKEALDRQKKLTGKAIAKIKELSRRDWIPCEERLPEENRTVIASTKFGVYPEARYTKEYGWEWASESGAENCWVELVEVQAWMPLPEGYVEDEQ